MKSGVVIGIRNGENEVNQGRESNFHYPSKMKYAMFTLCKLNLMSVEK